MSDNYCSAVNCQNGRKSCLCKSLLVFVLRCQLKQRQISSAAARGAPRSAYIRWTSM